MDVRGNCSLASCATQPFVWRGFTSTRVPRLESGVQEVQCRACVVNCVVCDTALCMAWVWAGPRQRSSGSDVAQFCGAGV